MTHPNKVKGNSYERELVNQANNKGLVSERAYASNGKALGEVEEVDLIVSGCRVQAKRRKKIASYLEIDNGVDAVAFREDRGSTKVLIKWDDFLDLVQRAGGW